MAFNLPELLWAGELRRRAVTGQVLQEMINADEIDQEQAHQLAR